MIAALDVFYSDASAHAAAILFEEWGSRDSVGSFTSTHSPVSAYEPGQFYMRELSPLLEVIGRIDRGIDTYLVDGYCHLSTEGAPGLGAHLHAALSEPSAIVGVAKNRYRQSRHAVEILRGNSRRALFVTAIGMDYAVAGEHVASMAGEFRIPAMLKAVDRLSRVEDDR